MHRENMATDYINFQRQHRLITEAFPKEIKISLVGGQWCKLSQYIYQPPVTMQELLMNGFTWLKQKSELQLSQCLVAPNFIN